MLTVLRKMRGNQSDVYFIWVKNNETIHENMRSNESKMSICLIFFFGFRVDADAT